MALKALSRAGGELVHAPPDVRLATLAGLGTLDWSRANTGEWKGASRGGRLSKNTASIVLAANAILRTSA